MKISGCSNITTLLVFMLLFSVRVQQARAGIYTCWGGCLNQCFFLGTINNNNRIAARFPCYVNCVATCFYPPPGSRTPPPKPPNPPDKVPAPSPSDSEESSVDDTTFKINKSLRLDKKKYTCITDCSLQTCHGGSELKNCLTSCIDKCRKLGLNISSQS